MSDFFKFYGAEPSENAFAFLGPVHVLTLLFIALCGGFFLYWLKRQNIKRIDRVIRVMAVLVPVLEFSHTVWLYRCGMKNIVKLLPFHLCATQSIFIPLAVFSKNKILSDYVWATSLIGGIFGMAMPAGVADYYPLLHYQTIQTMLLHALLCLVPLAMVLCKKQLPEVKNIKSVWAILILASIPAAFVDLWFGENYMFLNYPPEGTPLIPLFQNFGHGPYLFILASLAFAGVSLMFLPFTQKATLRREERRLAKQQTL